jgi:riboflavin synthase
MFTGLVETKGTLVRRQARGADARLTLMGNFRIRSGATGWGGSGPAPHAGPVTLGGEPIQLGESIAVDGVCLTVDRIVEAGGPGPSIFEVDASTETLARTTVGDLTAGAHVNLERAMPLGGRMGGHIVSGHIDAVGEVAAKIPVGGAIKVVFRIPAELARFVAPKGSICISGVSLTVNGAEGDRFDVVLVPHTRERTSLDALPVGARVNLEVDMLARYVARLLEHGREPHGSRSPAEANASMMAALGRGGYM